MHAFRFIICFAAGFLFALIPSIAIAQEAPVPSGSWATNPPSEKLLVTASGCRFSGNNGVSSVLIEGDCSWKPSSAGGILTIINVHAYKPAPVYFNVIWVDAKHIKVEGDLFSKQN